MNYYTHDQSISVLKLEQEISNNVQIGEQFPYLHNLQDNIDPKKLIDNIHLLEDKELAHNAFILEYKRLMVRCIFAVDSKAIVTTNTFESSIISKFAKKVIENPDMVTINDIKEALIALKVIMIAEGISMTSRSARRVIDYFRYFILVFAKIESKI